MWRPRSVHVTSQCVTFVRSSLHYIYICTSTSKEEEENKSSYCELSRSVPKEQQAKQKLPSAFSLLAIPLPQRHVHLVILCGDHLAPPNPECTSRKTKLRKKYYSNYDHPFQVSQSKTKRKKNNNLGTVSW